MIGFGVKIKRAEADKRAEEVFGVNRTAQMVGLDLAELEAAELSAVRIDETFVGHGFDRCAEKFGRHIAVRSIDDRLRGGRGGERGEAQQDHRDQRAPALII